MFANTKPRWALRLFPALAAMLISSIGRNSHAVAENVGSVSFLKQCPYWIGGDREFDGNGPDVDAVVTLRREASNERVVVDIFLHEKETKSDWTEAQLFRTFSLRQAPSGHPYNFIWAPGSGGVFGWVALGNAATYGNATASYVDNDHAVDKFPNPQWWVTEMDINGDTNGNDVGNCTTDDAYIDVRLPAIWFWHD
jgi:hypothetical protein